MKRTPAAIIDLDNCISDDGWRTDRIVAGEPNPDIKYGEYHKHCAWDSAFNLDIVRSLALRYTLFIFTARPEEYRQQTEQWLIRKMVPFKKVLMRATGDHRPSVEVKREMLINLDQDYEVHMAIDDRVDILDMYALEGVRSCRRVFIDTRGGHL